MGVLHGSMGSIVGLAEEELVSRWAAPIVCEVFELGSVVGSVEHEWKAGAERRLVEVMSLAA